MIYSARPKSPAALNAPPLQQVLQPSRHAGAESASAELGGAELGGAERIRVAMVHADSDFVQFDIELAERIITRIETRLPGRVRRLTVYTTNNAVVLTGECSTFYTKQIAQHTAMGVLEYERLINNIDVRVAK